MTAEPLWFSRAGLGERSALRVPVRGAQVSARVRPAEAQANADARGAAAPLVLLHGGGASGAWWDACVAAIDARHQVTT
ncbi:MAG: hypothetical protein GX814_08815, partial [Microbacteriaceae bacterium]|nr:hypothetical protein [Microbacteriaceae bacterium]